jgi:hypothetical protein
LLALLTSVSLTLRSRLTLLESGLSLSSIALLLTHLNSGLNLLILSSIVHDNTVLLHARDPGRDDVTVPREV